MDALWIDYLSDRDCLAKRDALVLAIRAAVVPQVYKAFLCCNRREVDSEVSLQALEQVAGAMEPFAVEWLASKCRTAIQRRARKPQQEKKILREMTEAFGDDTSEWRGA